MRRTSFSIKPAAFITAALVALSALAFFPGAHADEPKADPNRVLEPKEYDRLDGRGATHKKVDVIEWENNLEVHVYPKGSLKKLGMKLDKTNKKKPVMVIEYAFNGVPYTLIRRAILGIPMIDGFKSYYDTSASDYDKVVISGNSLALEGGLQAYPLAPPPVQSYPDYHDAIGGGADDPVSEPFSAEEVGPKPGTSSTFPAAPAAASRSPNSRPQSGSKTGPGTTRTRDSAPPAVDSNGGIKSFSW